MPTPVLEGAGLTVCATLTFLGDTTAIECDITVNLETTNGTKAGGKLFSLSYLYNIIVEVLLLSKYNFL